MNVAGTVKVWAAQIRAPFLLLAVFLVLIAGAVALYDDVFHGLRFALAMLGTVLAHVAVNLFNELSDYKTGIDSNTRRTPFSGGSGTMQAGLLKPLTVLRAALGVSLVALGIGVYLTIVSGWHLAVFIVAGGLAALFYTSHLAKIMLGEFFAGLCLGTFVVLGAYYAQAGYLTPVVIWVSIPPGILTSLLLLLNEFPDAEADRQGGRRHLVIALGWRRAAVVYTVCMALVYAVVIIGVAAGWLPPTVLLALLTLPLAVKACLTALRYGRNFEKMVSALGANVGVVLGTDLLIAVAYFIN